MLQDETKVRWHVRMIEKKNLVTVNEHDLDFHICTQEDFDEFYPPSEEAATFVKYLKQDKGLYCIDSDQDLKVRGQNEVDSDALVIDFKPCFSSVDSKCADQTLEEL